MIHQNSSLRARTLRRACGVAAMMAVAVAACSEAGEFASPTEGGAGDPRDGEPDHANDGAAPPESDSSVPPSDAGARDAADAADAATDGGGLPQTPDSPRVVSSSPTEGERTYPVEQVPAGAGYYYRKVITLVFDRPMDVSHVMLTVQGSGGDVRSFPGTWAADGQTLTAEVPPTQLPFQSGTRLLPLKYETTYRLDLSDLRSTQGDGVHATDAYLEDGALDFSTMAWDQLLEHTCSHTVDAVYQTLVLTAAPDAAPSFGSPHTHKRFRALLPGAGPAWSGHASLVPTTPRTYHVFVEESVPIQVAGPNGVVAGEVHALPPVCSLRYAHEFRFDAAGSYGLAFGPSAVSMFDVYFESKF
jgi:hypothetical protein